MKCEVHKALRGKAAKLAYEEKDLDKGESWKTPLAEANYAWPLRQAQRQARVP